MSSYLRPRRGKKSTAIAQLTSANPLKRGEIFFEVPDDGVGTGPGKIKMGDGTTGYEDLPYFSEGIGGTDVTIALPTSGWGAETISGETYYTQTVTVLGATANSTPIIVPVFSTDAEMEAYTNILRVETSSNAFKFIAIAAPEASLTVVAKSVLEATGSQTADLSQITSHLNTIDGQITQLNNDLNWIDITGNLIWDTNLTFIARHVYKRVHELQFSITISTSNLVNGQVIVNLPTPLTQSWISCLVLSGGLPSRIEVCEVATNGRLIFHGDFDSQDQYVVVSGQVGLI